jgi:6-pyruvoyltetrahydropterin/6-carboxytetrahydropterin synthase
MLLTVSKRLEFSASRRVAAARWIDSENLVAFGPESAARHGTGRNYVAYFIFTGPVNPKTGMLINISEIKDRAGEVLSNGFDHKFLNADHPVFRERTPVAENVARQLFSEVAPKFQNGDAKLVACHLCETPDRSATVYADGAVEGNYWFEFSAARRTRSPHLSEEENRQLFGPATAVHGHNYRARLTFRTEQPNFSAPIIRYDQIERCVHSLRAELDHRDLNNDVAGMKDRPMTTESLAEYIYERVNAVHRLERVRLHERDDFFAEVWEDETVFLGMSMAFSAAHRLHASGLTDSQNRELYGKCNNPHGHGHRYLTEATIGGELDPRTGTLYDFVALKEGLEAALEPWEDRHLDLEAEDFADMPSTGENIVRALWPKVDAELKHQLVRLRLWETPNNRFTLRRT